MLIVGATLGESIVPVLMGFLMDAAGPSSMPWFVLVSSIALVGIYMTIHQFSRHLLQLHHSGNGAIQLTELSEHSRHPLNPLHRLDDKLGNEDGDGDGDFVTIDFH
jgi:hypothetical protein